MKKKIILGIATAGTALAMLPMFAAFEAHVINVTATIENALTVPIKFIDYGTVFPQEQLDEFFDVSLSQSFMDEDRVDDVEYIIRQKPKCAITTNGGTSFDATVGQDGTHQYTGTGHVNVVLGDNPATQEVETNFPIATIDCGPAPRTLTEGETWGVLPNLCPYLSKHKGSDGVETKEVEIPAFHEPYTIVDGSIVWTEAEGYLSQLLDDTTDQWKLDLKVPCFGGYCAQDWEEFVTGINPDAEPDDFTQPIANEHKVFGCDLWIEVTGVSLNDDQPRTGTLTIVKNLLANDGLGTSVNEEDFSYTVNGGASTPFEADGTTVLILAAGDYDVVEDAETNYTTTYANTENGSLNCTDLTVTVGNNVTCTITNNDVVTPTGTLNIVKVIVQDPIPGGAQGTKIFTDFDFQVNAGAVTPFEADGSNAQVVVAGNYSVTEVAEAGYTTTYSNSLNANADCNALAVPAPGSVTCTVTNTFIEPGTITVDKIVSFSSVTIGGVDVTDFELHIDGPGPDQIVIDEVPATGLAPGVYTVSEVYSGVPAGIIFNAVFTGDCAEIAATNTGTMTIAAGETKTCTITNIVSPGA